MDSNTQGAKELDDTTKGCVVTKRDHTAVWDRTESVLLCCVVRVDEGLELHSQLARWKHVFDSEHLLQ